MKTVVIGEPSGAIREAIGAVYPRHKAVVDKYIARGVVLGIGPFEEGGNMAIFKTREEAIVFLIGNSFMTGCVLERDGGLRLVGQSL